MEDLLKSWGFPEFVEIFSKNDMNLELIEEITPDLLEKLIPTSSVGKRMQFLKKLNEYKEDSYYNSEFATISVKMEDTDSVRGSKRVCMNRNSSTPGPDKSKPLKTSEHFKITIIDKHDKIGNCNLCNKDIKMKNSNTTGLKRHLMLKHKALYSQQFESASGDLTLEKSQKSIRAFLNNKNLNSNNTTDFEQMNEFEDNILECIMAAGDQKLSSDNESKCCTYKHCKKTIARDRVECVMCTAPFHPGCFNKGRYDSSNQSNSTNHICTLTATPPCENAIAPPPPPPPSSHSQHQHHYQQQQQIEYLMKTITQLEGANENLQKNNEALIENNKYLLKRLHILEENSLVDVHSKNRQDIIQ